MTSTSKSLLDRKLDFLSGYQMLGGLIGLIFMIYLFFNIDEINLFYVVILGLGILFYLFSFVAGLFLFQRKTYGLRLSLVNQVLQIIGFSFFGYGMEYVAGLSFDVFIRYTDGLDINTNFGLSNWHILINNDTGILEISINIIAVLLVFFVLRLMKEYKFARSINELSDIGA